MNKKTMKKFFYRHLDYIKEDLRNGWKDSAKNDYHELQGGLTLMRWNEDLTGEEYDKIKDFTLKLHEFILKY